MDSRNYNEPRNCGLDKCDCSDDDNCGCTFPNNMSDYSCACADEDKCGSFSHEKVNVNTRQSRVEKETVCICTAQECDCSVERSETTN